MAYQDFINENIAPYAADHIGVYDSNGEKVGIIELGDFKPEYGERLYRFGLLSDVHNETDQTAESTEDLQRALALFNEKESVAFTCICGDITQQGNATELAIYKANVDEKSPRTTVYTCTGNHDVSNGFNQSLWLQYTGCEKNFSFNHKNDVFIFFSMNSYSLGDSGTPYISEDIDWLEETLEENKNKRCFIFMHLFFPERAGNLKNIYPSYNWLGGTGLTRLQALNDKYVNSIWFSGHSHWKWYLQKYQDNANIYRNNCGWCVHVPSCASPIDSDGVSTRMSMPLQSEGAIVDVYDNYVDIRGIDLKNNLYLPIATYRLDTTLQDLSAYDYVNIPMSWEIGSVSSSSGTNSDSNGSQAIRVTDFIEIDPDNNYYLSIEDPVNDESDLDNSLKDVSICCYTSSGTYLGRATGNLTSTNGSYYFKAGDKVDITSNIFGTYSTARKIKIKAFKYDDTTVDITPSDGDKIQLFYKQNSGSSGSDTDFEVPDGCTLLKASDFSIRSGSPTITTDDDGYINITFTAKGQGFWVKTSDMTTSTSSVNLVSIESYVCDQATDGLGFRSQYGYYYLTTVQCSYSSSYGIRFDLDSSQYKGTVPVTIKLKNVVIKCT